MLYELTIPDCSAWRVAAFSDCESRDRGRLQRDLRQADDVRSATGGTTAGAGGKIRRGRECGPAADLGGAVLCRPPVESPVGFHGQ